MRESDEVHHKVEALEDRVKELEEAVEVLYPFMERAQLRILALEFVLSELLRDASPETQHLLDTALQKRLTVWREVIEATYGTSGPLDLGEQVGKLRGTVPMKIGDI